MMAVEMSTGTPYSLAIPHIALLYKILGDFSVVQGM